VNILQTAGCVAIMENRSDITIKDIEWVIEFGQYNKRLDKKIFSEKRIGSVNGLAVYGIRMGALLEIEVTAQKAEEKSKGSLKVTGIIEEEEFNKNNGKMKRRSTAFASVENVLTVMKNVFDIPYKDYDIHINFPGGMPVDGPSAGVAIFIAVYSAILKKPVSAKIAMTGELSIRGNIHPVGGVHAKINAAREAGIEKVFIPLDNWQETYKNYAIEVIAVKNIEELVKQVFEKQNDDIIVKTKSAEVLTAQGI